MLVLTEKILGLIPNVYPHSCEDKWLIQKNDSGTIAKCTNEFCPIKGSYKLKSALDLLDFKMNVGKIHSLTMTLDMQLDTHMHLFKIACEPITAETEEIWKKYSSKLTLVYDHIKYKNSKDGFLLAKFMDAWGSESMGATRCDKIFNHMHDLNDFYSTYHDPTTMQEFIGEKLSISPYCSTVVNIVQFLITSKLLILDVAKYFTFTETKLNTNFQQNEELGDIAVCITGEVLNLKTPDGMSMLQIKPRDKVFSYWEKKYGIPLIENKSLTAKTKFLINDEGNRKGKVKKIKEKTTYSKCVITSSDVFEVMLEVLLGDTSGVYSANEKHEQVKSWT